MQVPSPPTPSLNLLKAALALRPGSVACIIRNSLIYSTSTSEIWTYILQVDQGLAALTNSRNQATPSKIIVQIFTQATPTVK
ncbi:hypothetical protein DID88_010330 [Monilinia fructigena]|uniref:Uncharacterized protein n=1 Tax=Monilinia fructigena TaxID=38457 RepID=A0A395IM73_9HELO|nr:hypothetical protein DID88_010330 [Monilinia fructigena]